jgi:hypothetical protein
MSGVGEANHEVTPQTGLRPEPQTPHSSSREAGSPARHGFQEISKSDCLSSLPWKRLPIDLGSEELSCTRWSAQAPLSRSESGACAGCQQTLWSPSLMR